jgi:hypothetical protein
MWFNLTASDELQKEKLQPPDRNSILHDTVCTLITTLVYAMWIEESYYSC